MYSTKYKSSSDSEEQMNVVHLDIVINIAYGKFSMKVYDIIVQEGIGSWLLGAGEKQAVRRFATAAEELAFQTAVDKLSNEMVRQLRRGEITDAIHIDKPWQYISSDLSGTKWASDKAWMNDMFSAAIKDANERMERLTANVGTPKNTPTTNATTDAASAGGSLFFTGVKTAINVLLAYEIFSNIDEVFNNPKNGYLPVMRYWEDRLKTGKITQERFEEAHKETLKIAVGRLAFQSPTLLLGSALAIFKILSMLRTATMSAVGLKKVAAGLNILGQVGSYSAKAVLAGYLHFLNSDQPIINVTVDGENLALKPLDAIKYWIVNDAFFVVGKTAGAAALMVTPIEQSLILTYEKLMEQYGLDINTGLAKVGAKPLATTVPGSKKSLGTSTPPPAVTNTPTPNANPSSDDKFNPADWVKTKSGYYQNTKTKELLSPQDFQRKSQ